MSRIFSERRSMRSFLSTVAGLVSIAALTACSSSGATDATSSDSAQALSEAKSSYDDTSKIVEACFSDFESCVAGASSDPGACKSALVECLPQQAGPGPHCGPPPGKGGKGKGGPRGPGGPGGPDDGCNAGPRPDGPPIPGDGPPIPGDEPRPPTDPSGGSGPVPAPTEGDPYGGKGAPPPPPPGGPNEDPSGDHSGPPKGGPGGPGGPDDGKFPPFCKHVPLPPPPAIKACHDSLKSCLSGSTDKKSCFEADRACMKAAFDAAFNGGPKGDAPDAPPAPPAPAETPK